MPVKAIAFIASALLAGLCTAFALATLWMAETDAYAGSYDDARRNALKSTAYRYIDNITLFAEEQSTGEELEWLARLGVYAKVQDADGNLIFDTTVGRSEYGEERSEEETILFKRELNGFCTELYVSSTVSTSIEMGRVNALFNFCCRMRNVFIVCGGLAALLFTADLVFLFCVAGRGPYKGDVTFGPVDRVPLDLLTGIYVLFAVLVSNIFYSFGQVGMILTALAAYVFGLIYALSFAVRIKGGTLAKNNLIYHLFVFLIKLCRGVWKRIAYTFKSLPVVPRAALIAAAEFFIELIVLSLFFDRTVLPWLAIRVVLFAAIIVTATSVRKLRNGAEKIASGQLECRVNTEYMTSDLFELAKSLNRIGEGLEIAVEERMKSERFRTELITNVSHDIKTPLTSIINYVDIIKKKGPVNPEIDGYVNVLERQSRQLKKLIEDLMEASKASTGNIAVNMEKCDLAVAVAQAVGEYRGRIEDCGIEVIVSVPEKPVPVMADGRHLWRILDNTLNNVVKYALGGTRFYASVLAVDGKAMVVLRNISREPLNIYGDELTERFVRGDSSRHTEGSGLGLNIAKSLAELQNAGFDITVDGDLFKIVITFDSLKSDGEEC